ncbi:BcNRPS1, nonribosomal peptide synthetase [Pseudovirgaria hyperparasitica]|uniref:BcNRPS1, nonribosomal peptide synthetase n=1 Tax=Pseudovirgaria hyperparasitica TaxID=470096 RepID=A0A6A6W2P6_9PEZI|nr:BcNRPS1, nonribosomal peptide synthetase [Pseudovirgaria hyperparasitica]KAF2756230.1 BcNRPS1, nonribosomal peptide synthetase [Pseudovirgaria hyperparasitica]
MDIKNSLHVPFAGLHVPSLISKAISTILEVPESHVLDDSNFIALGGDSLSAIKVAAHCHKNGLLLPTGAILRAKRLDELVSLAAPAPITAPPTPDPYAAIDFSSPELGSDHVNITPAKALDGSAHDIITAEDILNGHHNESLTELQLLLLRGSLRTPSLNVLTIQDAFKGQSLEAIKLAWERVVQSEPIFSELLQGMAVAPNALFRWRELHVPDEEAFDEQMSRQPEVDGSISSFDIVTIDGPIGAEPNKIITVWRVHHAFIDGYSIQLIRNKVRDVLRGEEIRAGPHFGAIVRQIKDIQMSNKDAAREFWDKQHEQFASAARQLVLSPQRLSGTQPGRTESLTVQFPDESLLAISKANGFTPAAYYSAAWALTLSKYTNSNQVCFGIVMSGRDLPVDGIFEVVGPLINTLPLFVAVDAALNAQSLVHDVSQKMQDLNQFSSSSIEDGVDRQFSSVLAMQFSNDDEASDFTDSPAPRKFEMESDIPLSIIVEGHGQVRLIFNSSYYEWNDMKLLGEVYLKSMHALLKTSNPLLSCLDSLLPARAVKNVMEWSNCFSVETFDDSKHEDLVTLFEKAVESNPEGIAIARGRVELTYREFDQAAGAVAHTLAFIEPEECVCVYADRSINWLIAIYGILKAKGVYTPLDPSAPAELRGMNLKRSGARVFLIPGRGNGDIEYVKNSPTSPEDAPAPQLLYIDEILSSVTPTDTCNVQAYNRSVVSGQPFARRRSPQPDRLAYVCFTSGSTGQPKAVRCTHKGLVAFQKDEQVRLFAAPGVTVAQVMSPVFDGSIHEIFSALSYGATLRLAPINAEDPFGHLRESQSTILTPSIAKVLEPHDFPSLQNVYLVGEQVPQSVCNTWGKKLSLYNMYGPTEATCGATIKRLLPDQCVNLGHPNPSSRLYILDRNLQVLPPGAVGEVFLAGVQVSKGYIGLPEQNAARFLLDAVLPESNEKMYRTGDLGYFEPATGEIHLLGRNDRQIKLRGYRLDLHDLEVRAARVLPMCDGVAIFQRKDYLIAAIRTTTATVASIKSNLAKELPPYAMPRHIIRLKNFPLTSAGKLDYKALDLLEQKERTTLGSTVLTPTEKIIADVWRIVLKMDRDIQIHKDSNFLSLGGHSILQLQLASRLSSVLRQRVNIRSVIQNPVLSDMARVIMGKGARRLSKSHNGSVSARLGQSSVSPIERDWFMKYQADLGSSAFNVSYLCDLDDSKLDRDCLITAFNTVLSRYDILRSMFRQRGNVVQRLLFEKPPQVLAVDSFLLRKAINTEFDLSSDYPIRVLVAEKQLLVCISHIICDLKTLEVLLQEVAALYNGADTLPRPQRFYSDTEWMMPIEADSAAFWSPYLTDIEHHNKPYLSRPRTSYSGSSKLYMLPIESMSILQDLHSRQGVTFHQTALSLVYLALQIEGSSHTDMVLGAPYLGRSAEDLNTVGLFLQPFPIRVYKPAKESDVDSFVRSVHTSAQAALAHALPWDQLLQVLRQSSDDSLRAAVSGSEHPNHALFDAMVTFHDNRDSPRLPIDGLQPVLSWAEGAKFGIMFEFSAISDTILTLRLEYDVDLFSFEQVAILGRRISSGLNAMRQGGMLKAVEEAMHVASETADLVSIPFGESLAALQTLAK